MSARLEEKSTFSKIGFDRLRDNFLRKQIFVSGSSEINQYELSPEILDSADESSLSW